MEAEKPKKYCVTIKQLEALQQHSFQTSPINKELYENNVRVKKYNGVSYNRQRIPPECIA